MSHTTSRSVEGDKLTGFLQQTLGTLAEGYVVSLAELSCLKEERHQKELLSLKEELNAKENELALVRENLEEVETALVSATTKITDMEDGVSKLLSKVTIPSTMIGYLRLTAPYFGRIEGWDCREGGLIRPKHYDVVNVDCGFSLCWSFNGFLITQLKKEGDNVLEGEQIAKYVNLD